MPNCCIRNCANRSAAIGGGQYTYFRFPKDLKLRKEWMEACGKIEETFNADHGRVCQQHFESVCFQEKDSPRTPGKKMLKLIPGSIPTKLLMLERKSSKKPGERIPLYSYKELVSSFQNNSGISSASMEEDETCGNETCRNSINRLHNKIMELEKANALLEETIQEKDKIIANLQNYRTRFAT